jgi:hypothetical protein
VPEAVVDAHEDAGKLALWVGLGAVAARAVAGSVGNARAAVAGLALLLHIGAAVTVGVAGFRGGRLVYEHAAGVRLEGRLIRHPGAEGAESREAARAGEQATPGSGEPREAGEPRESHRDVGEHETR